MATGTTRCPDAKLPPEGTKTYAPSFSLGALADKQTLQRLLRVVDWAFDEARRAQTPPPGA